MVIGTVSRTTNSSLFSIAISIHLLLPSPPNHPPSSFLRASREEAKTEKKERKGKEKKRL
jgi:hypothetical protein